MTFKLASHNKISPFLEFLDFSMHGLFLVIFNVFQSLWEPCLNPFLLYVYSFFFSHIFLLYTFQTGVHVCMIECIHVHESMHVCDRAPGKRNISG